MSPGTILRSIVCIVTAAAPASAADFPVSSASDIDNALNSAGPGDTLTMTDGVWTDQFIRFTGDGNPGQPITLRAQTPGGVTLNGVSRIEMGGTYLEVEGLRFEGGALGESSHIVRFRSGSTDAEHCVLRDTAIIDYNPLDRNTRYFWVSLYGTDNTVENCRFENQDHSGVTVVVWGDWPNNHVIRNNHFVDRPVGPDNGWETIRIGTSGVTHLSSQTTVESNLFERTNGEIEVISDKTQDNIHRYNTFLEMSATLTLRHATNALVYGNFFLGDNVGGSGGVRVIGPGHRIWNNYFQDLAGRTDGIIALEAGESDGAASGYQPVSDVVVAHNTFVDCGDPAFALNRDFGGNRDTAPTDITIVGNAISQPNQDVAIDSNGNIDWEDNLAFADGLGTAPGSGVTMLGSDPLFLSADGLYRPSAGGPLDGAVSPIVSIVADDMDGHVRGAPADAGADEISAASITRGPLDPEDVGPDWWDGSPPDGPDPALGMILEAEDADEILDPDTDGVVFTVATVTGASGDAVLVSPAGSRTDLGSGPHGTIAVYRFTPPASGDYTVYALARGFSGSTDSFFTPHAFDTDPDTTDTTSNNGQFRWETGATIAYDSAQGEVSLRFGRREAQTQIDAIIVYPVPNLSDIDLDYLLSEGPAEPCEADIDGNGAADFFDTLFFLRLFDADDPAADLSGNGDINSFDIFRHLNDLEAGCP